MRASPDFIELNFNSGAEFYSKYIVSESTASPSSTVSATASSTASSTASAQSTTAPTPHLPGYPKAVIQQKNDLIAGYFLDGNDTSDVAVLNIPSFSKVVQTDPPEFQSTLSKFLKQCKDKKRLIIDMRGNGGGDPFLAYDAFKQLFPNLGTPYSGLRFRAQPYANAIGIGNKRLNPFLYQIPFPAQSNLQSPDGAPFRNWSSLYGPHEVNGDNFSSIGTSSLLPRRSPRLVSDDSFLSLGTC